MKQSTTKIVIIGALCILLSACNGFFEKDNTPTPTPLTNFTPEVKINSLWSTSVNSGIEKDYLKIVPALGDDALFTTDAKGRVTATNKQNGATLWKKSTGLLLSAGPTANNHLVFVGSRKGIVVALNQQDGSQRWQAQLSSEILSPPAAHNGIVLVKTIDGELTALSEQDGHVLWRYHQTEPSLILRGGSAPFIYDDSVVVGFANGRIAKLTLSEGSLQWQQAIAIPQGSFAIQRMVDIDANPYVFKNKIYAATYQGNISSLDLSSGRENWTHDISSYTGLTVDNQRAYVSDATGHLWAFDTDTGTVDWRQTQLEARNITGPVLMDHYVVVGDGQGYVHWLSQQDGRFVARTRVNRKGIIATPVVDNNVLYVLTTDGHLAAFTIGQ